MPTPTYNLISSTTLAASASEVVFGSLPQTYRDLILVSAVRNTYAGTSNDNLEYRFNSDTGSNYNYVRMFGNGSAVGSQSGSNNGILLVGRLNEGNTTANTFSLNTLQIMDYSATDKHKSTLSRADVPDQSTWAWAGRWASNTAVTSITLTTTNGQLASNSTFALYGVIS